MISMLTILFGSVITATILQNLNTYISSSSLSDVMWIMNGSFPVASSTIGVATTTVGALLAAFTTTQWAVLVLFFSFIIFQQYLAAKRFLSRTFVHDGRRLRAQAGITSMTDTALASNESNQETSHGVSDERTQNFQTQVTPTVAETVTMPKANLNRVRTDMSDGDHYSTPMYIGQYQMTSAMTVNTVFANVLSNQFYGNNNLKRLFIDKRFAKFDVRFTINVTGNPLATGLAIASVHPEPPSMPGSMYEQNYGLAPVWSNMVDRALAVNHTIIDLSMEGVYTLDMPWTYFKDYLAYNNYASVTIPYSSLFLTVLSPYLPATGAPTSINVEIYANLMNVETIERAPYLAQGLFDFSTTNVTNVLEKVDNANLSNNITGDAISASVPNPFGLDNPPDSRNAETSVFRMAYQKVASWMTVLDVWKTSPTPAVVQDFPEDLARDMRLGVDEMSMDFFRGRWFTPGAPVAVSLTTSTVTGTLLYTVPITTHTPMTFGGTWSLLTTGDWTQWLSSFFRYWRGSMRFRIVVASNSFKRGKLGVFVNYGANPSDFPSTITSGALDPRSLPHTIIDLSNKDRIIDIEIPYKAATEFLRVPQLVGTSNGYTTTMPFQEYSLGMLGIYLLSPLQVSAGASTTVNLTVLQSYGRDFNFYEEVQGSSVGLVTQGGISIFPQETPLYRSHALQPFRNIRELLTRPAPIGTFTLLPASDGFGTSPLVIPIHPMLMRNDALWSGLCAAYSGLRGGYRIHVKAVNISGTTNVRLQLFNTLYPIQGNGTANPPEYGPDPAFDYAAIATGIDASGLNTQFPIPNGGFSGTPQLHEPLAYDDIGKNINNSVSGQNRMNTLGIPAIREIIVDNYSQPEVIIEIPDPSPMYRTQEVFPLFSSSSSWTPLQDRNMYFLVATAMDNAMGTNGIQTEQVSIEVRLSAADDTRFFWYNGGPTSFYPQTTGYQVGTATTFTYTHLLGK